MAHSLVKYVESFRRGTGTREYACHDHRDKLDASGPGDHKSAPLPSSLDTRGCQGRLRRELLEFLDNDRRSQISWAADDGRLPVASIVTTTDCTIAASVPRLDRGRTDACFSQRLVIGLHAGAAPVNGTSWQRLQLEIGLVHGRISDHVHAQPRRRHLVFRIRNDVNEALRDIIHCHH